MVTLFDELSDLSLIEIFSYLSCVDALWSFNNLNTRLTSLLTERDFYRCVNLSSIRRSRFKTFLSLLRLDEIESLVIDCNASSLQLRVWPHLPHLTKLTVKGVRDLVDLFRFAKRQRHTLTHLVIHSSEYSETTGMTKDVGHPTWNLCKFVTEILHHVTALRSIDLGTETSFFLHHWPFKRIQTPLINLTVTLFSMDELLPIMCTEPFAQTLQQLRITINDVNNRLYYNFDDISSTPQMKALEVFSIVKAFKCCFGDEWTFVDQITSIDVMPVLRQMSFCIVINTSDLIRMNHSALFTDFRHVDVRFAVVIDDDRSHLELLSYVQRYFPPMASATFISQCWSNDQPLNSIGQFYANKARSRQHIFYTLPWNFETFCPLSVPDRCIDGIEVFISSPKMIKPSSSRLIKLTMSENLPSPASIFSHIVNPNQIVELHLLRCDRQIVLNLPNLRHLVLTNSLDSLNTFLSTNIRSIQITIYHQCLHFTNIDWTVLTRLSNLPLLNSLRILLYNMGISLDDQSRRVIVETASMVSDFSFYFRRRYYPCFDRPQLLYPKHALFIDQLRKDILALPRNEKVYIFVEEDGCGMRVWF